VEGVYVRVSSAALMRPCLQEVCVRVSSAQHHRGFEGVVCVGGEQCGVDEALPTRGVCVCVC